ncbi:unnamed protein product [Coccothraustes coccothraustes]
MQALRKGEDAYLELSGAKGRSRTVFSRSRALESTGTGTMLSGRRSRFFASANRRARPLLRREERSSTTLAISAQPSNSSGTVLRQAEDAYLELSGAKGQLREVFSRSRALESTGTGTMLSGRRSLFFASTSRRARPLLRREERSRRTLAFSARTHQGQYLSSRLPFDRTERFLWREVLHNVAAHFARPPATLDCKS